MGWRDLFRQWRSWIKEVRGPSRVNNYPDPVGEPLRLCCSWDSVLVFDAFQRQWFPSYISRKWVFSEDTLEKFPEIPFRVLTTSSLPSPPRLTLHHFSANIGSTILFLVDPSIPPKPRAPVCFFLLEASHSPFCSAKDLPEELPSWSREVTARNFFPLKHKPVEERVALPIKICQRTDVGKTAWQR